MSNGTAKRQKHQKYPQQNGQGTSQGQRTPAAIAAQAGMVITAPPGERGPLGSRFSRVQTINDPNPTGQGRRGPRPEGLEGLLQDGTYGGERTTIEPVPFDPGGVVGAPATGPESSLLPPGAESDEAGSPWTDPNAAGSEAGETNEGQPRPARRHPGDVIRQNRMLSLERREATERAELDRVVARAGEYKDHVTFQDIPAGMLVVDMRVNRRKLREPRIREMARRWDWNLYQPLVVNIRATGQIIVVDGQHRLGALLRLYGPEKLLRCEVLKLKTLEEEQKVFSERNAGRKALAINTLVQSRLDWGHPEWRAIQDILAQHGLRIEAGKPNKINRHEDGEVVAAGTLYKLFQLGGAPAVNEVVSLLHDAFGGNPNGYRAVILEGTWEFLLRYSDSPKYNRRRMVEKIIWLCREPQDVPNPEKLLMEAARIQQTPVVRLRPSHLGMALHRLFNHALQDRSRELPGYVVDHTPKGPTFRALLREWRQRYALDEQPVEPVSMGA